MKKLFCNFKSYHNIMVAKRLKTSAARKRRSSKPRKSKTRVARRVKARNSRRASKPRKSQRRVARRVKRITKKMQTGSKWRVWSGTAVYTKGGLTKKDLCKNSKGKVVSKRRMIQGKKMYAQIKGWNISCGLARKQLGIEGFKLTKKGTEYYKVAKEYYKKYQKKH